MYRCPKCQSNKIMPLAGTSPDSPRPNVPKSLMMLLPSIFILLCLGVYSILVTIFGKGIGTTVQGLILAAFVLTAVSAVMFVRDLPDFKLSLQAFLQNQKRWKCRDCGEEWENQ